MTDSLQIGCNIMEVVGSTPSRDINFIFAKMYKVYLKDHLVKDFVVDLCGLIQLIHWCYCLV